MATKMVNVLREFKLTRDDSTEKFYEKGRHAMPVADANHYYTKLHIAPSNDEAAAGSYEAALAKRKYADERRAEWQEAEDDAVAAEIAFNALRHPQTAASRDPAQPAVPASLGNVGALTETQMADLNAAAISRGEESPFPDVLPPEPEEDADEEDADEDDGTGDDSDEGTGEGEGASADEVPVKKAKRGRVALKK